MPDGRLHLEDLNLEDAVGLPGSAPPGDKAVLSRVTAALNLWMLLLIGALLLQVVAAVAMRPVRFQIAEIALVLPRDHVVRVTAETESVHLTVPLRTIAPTVGNGGTWLRPETLRIVLDPAPSSLDDALKRFRRRENEPEEDDMFGLRHFARPGDPASDFYFERRGDDVRLMMLCTQAPSASCDATIDFRRGVYVTYSFDRAHLPQWQALRDGVLGYMDDVAR